MARGATATRWIDLLYEVRCPQCVVDWLSRSTTEDTSDRVAQIHNQTHPGHEASTHHLRSSDVNTSPAAQPESVAKPARRARRTGGRTGK